MYDLAQLNDMAKEELRRIAHDLKIESYDSAEKPGLIKMILEQQISDSEDGAPRKRVRKRVKKEDEIIPLAHAADFHRDIKNSTVCLLDSCGHCPMMEQPKETEAVVRKFFSE